MGQLTLTPPAKWSGSPEQQLVQCYSYLFQMREQLQVALQELDGGARAETKTGSIQRGGGGTAFGGSPQPSDEVNQLRSLIIKTANKIQSDMDRLKLELNGTYVAQSEFGSYLEQINLLIEADPSAITQYYSFASDLKADIDRVDGSFERYKQETEGYIRTGIVQYDESGLPVYGVAVGQGLTVTEVDGERIVDSTQFRSVFTARKLSFYQADVEVAYLSNDRLYVKNITVLGNIDMGSKWRISFDGGFSVKWIGG